MKKLSIVVPCWNEEGALPIFFDAMEEVEKTLKKRVEIEYVLVNDGSKDRTLEIFRELHQKDARIHYFSFSKNFGKEAAMYAGLEHATGDYVVLMDVDLQDPPELLPVMLDGIEKEGYDCIATKSTSRHGYSFLRKTFTKWFYRIVTKVSKTEMIPGARDFRMMKRVMVDAVVDLREYNRYTKGLFSFVGFDTKWIEYENRDRTVGKSRFDFKWLFSYGIEAIVSFSTAPLVVAAFIGVLFCLIAFVMIVIIIVKTLVWGDPVSGWPSLVCILFLVSGIQLFCTGIIGEYLAKTYLETKKRPLYILKETDETYEKPNAKV